MLEDNFMIKSAVKNDAGILADLAIQMWHDNTVLDLEKEFKTQPVVHLNSLSHTLFFRIYAKNRAYAKIQIP